MPSLLSIPVVFTPRSDKLSYPLRSCSSSFILAADLEREVTLEPLTCKTISTGLHLDLSQLLTPTVFDKVREDLCCNSGSLFKRLYYKLALSLEKILVNRCAESIRETVSLEMQVRSKSSLAIEKGLIVLDAPHCYSKDFCGEVEVTLYNTNKEKSVLVNPGDEIAELTFKEVLQASFLRVDSLSLLK